MTDPTKVAELRRLAVESARGLAWGEQDSAKAALLATEIGTNLLKHARDGSAIVIADSTPAGTRLQFVSIDQGPGIADVDACLQDGYSTAGSPGTGLGALSRNAGSLDIFSSPGKGTVLLAELFGAAPPTPAQGLFEVGGVCLPCPGESVSGDGWDYRIREGSLLVMLCDGLGHGVFAAEASRLAVAAFRDYPGAEVAQSLMRLHDALRVSRGAAAAVAMVDRRAGRLRFCGVGNISGSIVSGHEVKHLVSHNGILGHSSPRFAEFEYAWNDSCHLVMHSDGIASRWRPQEPPGLWRRRPSLIAGALCRDWLRGRDDATAVVARAT